MNSRFLAIVFLLGFASTASSQYEEQGQWSRYGESESLRRFSSSGEPFGAEELDDADNMPRIPEPMVFDLVRPLGARRGEAEVNVLAIIPAGRKHSKIEWAPEAEVAIADGLAFEFELPFEEGELKAYKFAGQKTFGTAFHDRFIHGLQSILVVDRQSRLWSPTVLYLAGLEFDDRWSALAMIGARTVIDDADRAGRTERLFNFSVFRHITSHATLGVESNTSVNLRGESELRLMPQTHYEWKDHLMIQFGYGVLFQPEATTPEAAFRLIRSF